MNRNEQNKAPISKQTLNRMPAYLLYLKNLDLQERQSISASAIASDLNLNEIQVRKDLAAVSSSGGKPRKGFDIHMLIEDIKAYLGYDDVNNAVIAGAGKLGQALLCYDGFSEYGLNILAAFDSDPAVIHQSVNAKMVYPIEKMPEICHLLNIQIGIITVPAAYAQLVCDQFVKSGIRAIWNFAPVLLNVPQDILVQNENMAVSLAILSKHLSVKLKKND
jgi:redox-sensing transcriptional repressor